MWTTNYWPVGDEYWPVYYWPIGFGTPPASSTPMITFTLSARCLTYSLSSRDLVFTVETK